MNLFFHRLGIMALALFFAVPLLAERAGAQNALPPEKAYAALAGELIGSLDGKARIALMPFDDLKSGISRIRLNQIYGAILKNLFRETLETGGRLRLVARRRLSDLIDANREFDAKSIQDVLESAKADIQIVCVPGRKTAGVEINCDGFRTSDAVQVTSGDVIVKLPIEALPLDLAIEELAEGLWPSIKDFGKLEQKGMLDTRLGAFVDLGNFVLVRVVAALQRRANEAAADRIAAGADENALLQGRSAARPSFRDLVKRNYVISGRIMVLDAKTYDLNISVRTIERPVALESARVDVASIDESLRLDGGTGGGGAIEFIETRGDAIISDRLDRDSAIRAAENLARARLVAKANKSPGPSMTYARHQGDAARLMTFLKDGFPYAEVFTPVSPLGKNKNKKVAFKLRAQFKPIGRSVRLPLQAKLRKKSYREGEDIRITIASGSRAHVGIFAWGMNDRIVRMYPNERVPNLILEQGQKFTFPRKGEFGITSAPSSGNLQDNEAFIIIASTNPIDFEKLARRPGYSLAEALRNSIPGREFLNRLARENLDKARVIFLPYTIRARILKIR